MYDVYSLNINYLSIYLCLYITEYTQIFEFDRNIKKLEPTANFTNCIVKVIRNVNIRVAY